MLDHVGIPVSDFARSKAFYTAVFAPLGYGLVMEVTPEMTGDGSSAAGFGKGKPDFWISSSDRHARTHVAILAADRAAVRKFHETALAAGATDNGPPGLRPHYHENYYGAFVIDPDGHNIEAVCHAPE
ncbi:catechol 2,3-dioxygenase-like lactoylglutathione lyase family enzyme [Luteimonas cucumeris]|uniref:Catechol 2,3-dioxygenase-like lactoylglutathione lyase family enzyme n=1 Tax=Luteimonas cucumeris TaxID=985012 RepID=A0A562L7N2_9GAMM|nr:VOC family protein [Luteimonas cucumeris]TWI03631.1 catechol 2,3-dioxygenase-like lactoylglutathione lyase family enzyme [Luteimonas cucumeris]